MSKKLDIEFIRDVMKSEHYTLLSTIYLNSKTKLDYTCSKGHHHSVNWDKWRRGDRCPYCSGRSKHTIEEVRKAFEEEGYVLLTEEYINTKQPLHFICPNNHRHFITFDSWKNQGGRCFHCSNRAKPSIEFIRESFSSEGYTLLSNEYVSAKNYLSFICPLGHKHEITWDNWKQGKRCFTCKYINHSGPKHPNWKGGISCEPYCQDWTKEYKDFIKERDGYKCLNPDCWCKDNRLHVHHIDYHKKNCGPNNLITLCGSCNSRANKDRKWHKAWYQAIIKNRYHGVQNG